MVLRVCKLISYHEILHRNYQEQYQHEKIKTQIILFKDNMNYLFLLKCYCSMNFK